MTLLAGGVAVVVLFLWLFERVPPFVPTLILAAAVPLLLGDRGFGVARVLDAGAQPVLALFFGGFVLAAAARRHHLDRALVGVVVAVAGGRRRRLVAGLAAAAAVLSMIIGNIAAAALLVHVALPLVEHGADRFRRAALLAVAFGANIGGIATPIGTGPNAIAIAAIGAHGHAPPSFAGWMAFGLPIAALLLAVAVVAIVVVCGVDGQADVVVAPVVVDRGGRAVVFVIAACAALWLSAPLTGIDPAVVSVGAAAVVFALRLVPGSELARLDWSTLLLIAGGLVLGELLDALGVLRWFAGVAGGVDPGLSLVVVVVGASLLASVMSNTATATLLIPLALPLVPAPSTAVLVAVACSLGAPFVISTPQNALVAGHGVTAKDFFAVGAPVLVVGMIVVVLTGPAVLAAFGLGAP